MSDLDIFGPLFIPTQLGSSITSTLTTWISTYLGVVERAVGINGSDPTQALPSPASYTITDDGDHWPEDQPPAVVIEIPGTLEKPVADGRQNYRAFWDVCVHTYVDSNDRMNTERLAKYYAAATRLCVLQKGAPAGGLITGLVWTGESYDRKMNNLVERTLACASVRFSVEIRGVAQALGGPLAPAVDPTQAPADWPAATTFPVTYTPEPPQ